MCENEAPPMGGVNSRVADVSKNMWMMSKLSGNAKEIKFCFTEIDTFVYLLIFLKSLNCIL